MPERSLGKPVEKQPYEFRFDLGEVRRRMHQVIVDLGQIELMLESGYTYNNIDNRIVLDMVRVARSMTAQLRERLNSKPGPEA